MALFNLNPGFPLKNEAGATVFQGMRGKSKEYHDSSCLLIPQRCRARKILLEERFGCPTINRKIFNWNLQLTNCSLVSIVIFRMKCRICPTRRTYKSIKVHNLSVSVFILQGKEIGFFASFQQDLLTFSLAFFNWVISK